MISPGSGQGLPCARHSMVQVAVQGTHHRPISQVGGASVETYLRKGGKVWGGKRRREQKIVRNITENI